MALLQIGGAGTAWIYTILKRFGLVTKIEPIGPEPRVLVVSPLAAVEALRSASTQSRVVVIIEGPRDWPFLSPVLATLNTSGIEMWCISRTILPAAGLVDLPYQVYAVENPGLVIWTRLLTALHADAVVTTLTDLGGTAFPKSCNAQYVYIFHSLVSTHVSYASGALDSYDVMLCPGQTHVAELEARDEFMERPKRRIVEVGYPFLDVLTLQYENREQNRPRRSVVIAPSWFSDELYESVWLTAARSLAKAGWDVIIRPHPESIKRSPRRIRLLKQQTEEHNGISIDLSSAEGIAMCNVDALITDWSGAGIEAAVLGIRVVFIDTPRKVRNWKEQLNPSLAIELQARGLLGLVLPPGEVDCLPTLLSTCPSQTSEKDAQSLVDRIISYRGDAAKRAASEIRRVAVAQS